MKVFILLSLLISAFSQTSFAVTLKITDEGINEILASINGTNQTGVTPIDRSKYAGTQSPCISSSTEQPSSQMESNEPSVKEKEYKSKESKSKVYKFKEFKFEEPKSKVYKFKEFKFEEPKSVPESESRPNRGPHKRDLYETSNPYKKRDQPGNGLQGFFNFK